MRLKVSGDKNEIRQSYIPALFPHIIKPLMDVGAVSLMGRFKVDATFLLLLQSAVAEVMEVMDDYYISKEDWDTIIELGVDEKKDDTVLKKISTATKTALTKKCVTFMCTSFVSNFAHGFLVPHVGTTRVNTRYLSTRPKIWAKCQRNSPAGLHLILRKPM